MVTELIVKQNLELQAENERLKYDLKVLQHELDECRKVLKIQKEAQARLKNTKSKYTAKEILAMTELFRKEIKDLPLAIRTQNVLIASDIRTLGALVKNDKTILLKVRYCGPMVKNDIEQFLQNSGLSWGMNVDDFIELDAKKAISNK
jgi:DNA-directed RNA polymerase alpha subunit